jgi:hypothetical protein
MSEWKDDDEVTTTYGSIQLSLGQAHAAGVKTERERIIKLFRNEMCKLCEHAEDSTYCVDSSNFCEMNFINIDLILEGTQND